MKDQPLPLSNATHIGIVQGDAEVLVTRRWVNEMLGVDEIVRLRIDDFNALSSRSGIYTHFNLEFTTNEAGKMYGLVPIVRPGRRLQDGTEILPVIDIGKCRIGQCLKVLQNVPIDGVTSEYFVSALPDIQNADELSKTLVHRYRNMFPTMGRDELLLRGCAISVFRLIEVVPDERM